MHWRVLVQSCIPQSLFEMLDGIWSNMQLLAGQYFELLTAPLEDVIASISIQTVLPPLITLLTIYFMVVSLYRTTAFFMNATLFLVKWGAFIGLVGICLGYVFKATMPEIYSNHFPSKKGRRKNIHGMKRPAIWDSFEEHRQWREATGVENSFFGDNFAKTAQEIVDRIVDTVRQVRERNELFETLSGAFKLSTPRGTSKEGKSSSQGKVKVR